MTHAQSLALVCAVASHLAVPGEAPDRSTDRRRWMQSLALGVPGIAMLHTELASCGLGPWHRADAWLTYMLDSPVTSGSDSHSFYGAPAVARALATAAHQRPGSYGRALDTLDRQILRDTRRRLEAAEARIAAGQLPVSAEFDALQGLTGYGSYLLHRSPGEPALRSVLDYLVHLTDPVKDHGEVLPGWWTLSGPSGKPSTDFPGGHANFSVAHGSSGILALLSLSVLAGVTVHGQRAAIETICSWHDRWRNPTRSGPTWPYWISRSTLRSPVTPVQSPMRPSWCYGAAGMARAQQLAALATHDPDRRRQAEEALVHALFDPDQLAATTDPALCHGYAGLAHLAARVAADATPDRSATLLAGVLPLLEAVHPLHTEASDHAGALIADTNHGPGFLNGAAGIALALLAPITGVLPASPWDACLLVS